MDLGAVLLSLVIALGVKLSVMILGARIVLKLYKATYMEPPKRLWLLLPEEHLREVKVLWWALVLFFISELTCGIEVYVIFRSSWILSGIHSISSGLGMGLFALGMYIYLDKKIIRYGDSACLANRICRGCTIDQKEGCKFLVVLLLVTTFVALAAIPALFAPTDRMHADMSRYTLPFESINAWYDGEVQPYLKAHFPNYGRTDVAYFLPETQLVIEFRILPIAAMIIAVTGIVLLKRRKEIAGMRCTALAFGMLCYTYLEVILYPATGLVLIGSLGHELAELWFLLITAEFLRRAFPPKADPQPEAPS